MRQLADDLVEEEHRCPHDIVWFGRQIHVDRWLRRVFIRSWQRRLAQRGTALDYVSSYAPVVIRHGYAHPHAVAKLPFNHRRRRR